MRQTTNQFVSRWSLALVGLAAFAVLVCLPGSNLPQALADEDTSVVIRVEEDWVLVLNEPASELVAPQFHTVMSPFQHLKQGYFQVSWNYRELPAFEAGGLQIQAWQDEDGLDDVSVGENSLSQDAETIVWTQSLETNGSQLAFKIVNGQSSSWGSFGGDEWSSVVSVATTNLNNYSAAVSKANSWITFGSNRVDSLVITEVRYYDVNGLTAVDSEPVVVYEFSE